jgi:RNA polymerase sigma factor (sigma-70 family)
MGRIPGGHFLRNTKDGDEPGVFTVLLRSYIEDREPGALEAFFHLLYEEHFTDIAIQVHSYGPASDLTVREVINDSMAKLLEDVVAGKYRKPPDSAVKHLKYLLRRKFIDRRRWWDKDHDDVHPHRETIIDPQAQDPAAALMRAESDQVADRRFEEALSALSETDQKIIRLRLEGHEYDEIAKLLGIAPGNMRSYGPRAYAQLMNRLVENAPTMANRLKEMKARWKTPEPKAELWPTRDEIRAALPRITARVRDAVTRLHFDGVSREDLEHEIGEETLEILLRRGYDLLEERFKVSFPEAFERATS